MVRPILNLLISLAIIVSMMMITGCQKIIETKKTISNVASAIRSSKKVSEIIESDKKISEYSDDEIKQLIEYGKLAVENARNIDYELLDGIFPDLGQKVESELVAGVDLIVKGYEKNDQKMIKQGKKLVDSWGKWFEENIDNIKPLSFLKK